MNCRCSPYLAVGGHVANLSREWELQTLQQAVRLHLLSGFPVLARRRNCCHTHTHIHICLLAAASLRSMIPTLDATATQTSHAQRRRRHLGCMRRVRCNPVALLPPPCLCIASSLATGSRQGHSRGHTQRTSPPLCKMAARAFTLPEGIMHIPCRTASPRDAHRHARLIAFSRRAVPGAATSTPRRPFTVSQGRFSATRQTGSGTAAQSGCPWTTTRGRTTTCTVSTPARSSRNALGCLRLLGMMRSPPRARVVHTHCIF